MAEALAPDKGGGKLGEQGLLFEYTVKVLLVAGLLELVLYRLVSRLGMHLSKVAEKHESVRLLFETLSAVGFTLLNVVSILVFLALFVLLLNRMRGGEAGVLGRLVVPALSLLVLLTMVYLVFPPAMLGSIVYNVVAVVVLLIVTTEYMQHHRSWIQRTMMASFILGIMGWLYYQTISTTFGYFNLTSVPPLAHEFNRAGEAFMVLASVLVLWAYGPPTFRTNNKRQRMRVILFALSAGVVFFGLLFMDFFLVRYDPAVAESVRKAGQGIGWIFQMGMGYTFYLPFAFYVAGLVFWTFTVVKLLTMGRMAGYGIGLMFIAGYALQLSHLTLMVVLGLMLVTMDRRAGTAKVRESLETTSMVGASAPVLGSQT